MQDSGALVSKICRNCVHHIGSNDRCDKTYVICYAGATACQFFDRSYNACGNCKHFLDGKEKNLCCDLKRDIVYEYDKACDKYERMDT